MCGQNTAHHVAILEELVEMRQLKLAQEVKRVFLITSEGTPAADFKVPENSTGDRTLTSTLLLRF